ncbi:MAG: hypothetical protein E6J61_12720 [Deltaproteobacteria bacterium]|nr:MAG: hypothetical protein E6J61_12720 [Deltaproteobacteria bacterium]
MNLVPYGRNGRTFDQVTTAIPGVQPDANGGIAMNGSGSPEQNYIIDGVNVSDPAYGTLGTTLIQDFVQEVDVKTGGYQAEYGRATGGIVNVVTKSGGNEFHGSVFVNWSPFEAPRKQIGALGQALSSEVKQRYNLDFGAELGGPIMKDKLWFFAGVAPQFISRNVDRIIGAQQSNAAGQPVLDSSGNPATTEVGRQTYTSTQTTYNLSGKLTYLINENHSLALAGYGNPTKNDGVYVDRYGFITSPAGGSEGSFLANHELGAFDTSLRYSGKLFNKTMLVEATAAYHRRRRLRLRRNAHAGPLRRRPQVEQLRRASRPPPVQVRNRRLAGQLQPIEDLYGRRGDLRDAYHGHLHSRVRPCRPGQSRSTDVRPERPEPFAGLDGFQRDAQHLGRRLRPGLLEHLRSGRPRRRSPRREAAHVRRLEDARRQRQPRHGRRHQLDERDAPGGPHLRLHGPRFVEGVWLVRALLRVHPARPGRSLAERGDAGCIGQGSQPLQQPGRRAHLLHHSQCVRSRPHLHLRGWRGLDGGGSQPARPVHRRVPGRCAVPGVPRHHGRRGLRAQADRPGRRGHVGERRHHVFPLQPGRARQAGLLGHHGHRSDHRGAEAAPRVRRRHALGGQDVHRKLADDGELHVLVFPRQLSGPHQLPRRASALRPR